MSITQIRFKNFKALKHFHLTLRRNNVLVGSNNSGKSTSLDGVRALAGALRYARRLIPKVVRSDDGHSHAGYEIPDSSIPITLANMQTDYADVDAVIEYQLSNKRWLKLIFPPRGMCRLVLDSEIMEIRSISHFASVYPLDIAVVPTLSPFEEEESLIDEHTLQRWGQSRRSSRMFRNIWHRRSAEEFAIFKTTLENTWPSMSIARPEILSYGNPVQLNMFCKEGRIDREVYWSGFDFRRGYSFSLMY
jgi:predicted ATP-dependent endonuclease of OLD family